MFTSCSLKCLVVFLGVFQGVATAQSTLQTHLLQIRYYKSLTFTNGEADRILADVSKLLQDCDGTDDVACPVEFKRKGAVKQFTEGNGSVDSEADYKAVLKVPGQVKIVDELNWCGGPKPEAIGCADTPGDSIVVERYTASEEGVLWAHEIGHNKGLPHRHGTDVLMKAYVHQTHTRINQAESQAFLSTQAVAQSGQQGPAMSVQDFVRNMYFEGIPWDEAMKYGPGDAKILLDMLQNPENAPYRANIITTLCLIGDERSAASVMEFIMAGEGPLSDADYTAKKAALVHLGHLLQRYKNPEGFRLLQEVVRKDELLVSQLHWSPPKGKTAEYRNQQLRTMALYGLAYSGPSGLEVLQNLQKNGLEDNVKLTENEQAVLQEAVKISREISEKGLMRYYEDSRK
ncbi:hypothetical protein GC163_06445 [bacterium]|nr:hypothetical protein [bacterium]